MRKKTGKTTAKKVDLLKLIKNRRTIRKYQDRPISKRILNKIIEAGVWGPSVHGIQPWQFLVINNASFIKEVAKILLRRSMEKEIAGRILLDSTANTINNAPLLIAVYNNKEVVKLAEKFGDGYKPFARIAEISASSAAIQNMLLMASALGVGACWLDMPLFCQNEINKFLNVKEEKLVAILTLGYPAEKGKRSQRKLINKIMRCIP